MKIQLRPALARATFRDIVFIGALLLAVAAWVIHRKAMASRTVAELHDPQTKEVVGKRVLTDASFSITTKHIMVREKECTLVASDTIKVYVSKDQQVFYIITPTMSALYIQNQCFFFSAGVFSSNSATAPYFEKIRTATVNSLNIQK